MRIFLEEKKKKILKEMEEMDFNDESKVMEWITGKVIKIGDLNINNAKESAEKFSEEGT